MTQPIVYNVCPNTPTIKIEPWIERWQKEEAPLWTKLWDEIGGVNDPVNGPHVMPLTIKARYITGIIFAQCASVRILLAKENLIETTFYPAYGIFAAAVELLGRCITGNDSLRNTDRDLITGFQWLKAPTFPQYQDVKTKDAFVDTRRTDTYSSAESNLLSPNPIPPGTTPNYRYTINDLAALRNFCAHGQATHQDVRISELYPFHNMTPLGQATTPPTTKNFNYNILTWMPRLIGDAMQAYLIALSSEEELATMLARASVTPYRSRALFDSQGGFGRPHLPSGPDSYPAAVGEVIRKMDWTHKESRPQS